MRVLGILIFLLDEAKKYLITRSLRPLYSKYATMVIISKNSKKKNEVRKGDQLGHGSKRRPTGTWFEKETNWDMVRAKAEISGDPYFSRRFGSQADNKNRLMWLKNEESSEIASGTWGKSFSQSRTHIPVPGSLVYSDQISTTINCRKEPSLEA
jgi:hypothetical protein